MKKGFTLIELLLYVLIIGVVMSAMLPMALSMADNGAKSRVQEEVASTARNVMEKIKYKIRNAKDISAISANSLTLTNYSGANTVFGLTAGKVTINEGSTINLNSDDTNVTALTFTDFRSGDLKTKNIQVQMTMQASFSATVREEFNKTVQLQTSAELRGL
jgi:prepilin-type N-terminal cleavage/methylation domain-containing protein